MNTKIIAVDFDGTLCENNYPYIGAPKQVVLDYVKREQKNGAKIILWTCRTGKQLEDAVAWCAENGVRLDAVNKNVDESIAAFGGDTRKVFAHEYIDDRAISDYELSMCYKKLYEQLLDDFEHALYFAGKNNNVCNFCEHDCGENGVCKGRENWIECNPKWRGIVIGSGDEGGGER